MKPLTGVLIGVGALAGIGLLIAKFGVKSTPITTGLNQGDLVNPNEPSASSSIATSDQFDKIVDLGKAANSAFFTSATPQQLLNMRNTFSSKFTYDEANDIIRLISKPQSTWKASDTINYAIYMQKWKDAATASKPTAPTTDVNKAMPSPTTTYDVLTDTDYNSKTPILDNWYSTEQAKNKKRIFPRRLLSKNDFNSKFLPIGLGDLKQYTSLVLKPENDRDVKDVTNIKNIRAKYPTIFTSRVVRLYSFNGDKSATTDLTNNCDM